MKKFYLLLILSFCYIRINGQAPIYRLSPTVITGTTVSATNPSNWMVSINGGATWNLAASAPQNNSIIEINLDSLDILTSTSLTVDFTSSNQNFVTIDIYDLTPDGDDNKIHAINNLTANIERDFIADVRKVTTTSVFITFVSSQPSNLSLFYNSSFFTGLDLMNTNVNPTFTVINNNYNYIGGLTVNKGGGTLTINTPVISQYISFLDNNYTVNFNSPIKALVTIGNVNSQYNIISFALTPVFSNFNNSHIYGSYRITLDVDNNDNFSGSNFRVHTDKLAITTFNLSNNSNLNNLNAYIKDQIIIYKNVASSALPHFQNVHLAGDASTYFFLPNLNQAATFTSVENLHLYKGDVILTQHFPNGVPQCIPQNAIASTTTDFHLQVTNIIDHSQCSNPLFVNSNSNIPGYTFKLNLINNATIQHASFRNITVLNGIITVNRGADLGGNTNINFANTAGATFTWNGSASNDWFDFFNWTSSPNLNGCIPCFLDNVIIPNNSSNISATSGNPKVGSITFDNNTPNRVFTLGSYNTLYVSRDFIATANNSMTISSNLTSGYVGAIILYGINPINLFNPRSSLFNNNASFPIDLYINACVPALNATPHTYQVNDHIFAPKLDLILNSGSIDFNPANQPNRTITVNGFLSDNLNNIYQRQINVSNTEFVCRSSPFYNLNSSIDAAMRINFFRNLCNSNPYFPASPFNIVSDQNTRFVFNALSLIPQRLLLINYNNSNGTLNKVHYRNDAGTFTSSLGIIQFFNNSNSMNLELLRSERSLDILTNTSATPIVTSNFEFAQGFTFAFQGGMSGNPVLSVTSQFTQIPNLTNPCSITRFISTNNATAKINTNNSTYTPNPLSGMEINNVENTGTNVINLDANSSNVTNSPGWTITPSSSNPPRIFYWIGEGNTPYWSNPDNWSLSPPTAGDDVSAPCLPGRMDVVVFANDDAFPQSYPLLNSSTSRYQVVVDIDAEVHSIIWGNNPNFIQHFSNPALFYINGYINSLDNANTFNTGILQSFTKNPLFHSTVFNGSVIINRSNSTTLNIVVNNQLNILYNRRVVVRGSLYLHPQMHMGNNTTNPSTDCPVFEFINKNNNTLNDYFDLANGNPNNSINSSIVFNSNGIQAKNWTGLSNFNIELTANNSGGIVEGIFIFDGQVSINNLDVSTPCFYAGPMSDIVDIANSNIYIQGFSEYTANSYIGAWTYASATPNSLISTNSYIQITNLNLNNHTATFLSVNAIQNYNLIDLLIAQTSVSIIKASLHNGSSIRRCRFNSLNPNNPGLVHFDAGSNYSYGLGPALYNGSPATIYIDTLILQRPNSVCQITPQDVINSVRIVAISTPCTPITIRSSQYSLNNPSSPQAFIYQNPRNNNDLLLFNVNIQAINSNNSPGQPYPVFGPLSTISQSTNWQIDPNVTAIGFGLAPSFTTACSQLPLALNTNFWGDQFTTYTWSDGQTGQNIQINQPGTYTVTVNYNNGCVINQSTNIIINNDLSTSEIINHVTCNNANNGSIQINLNQYSPSHTYQYVWSNGNTTSNIANLSAGTYTVTISSAQSSACTITRQITVTQPPVLSANLNNITNNTCFTSAQGSINISAVGGTPNYTYLWNDGATTSSLNNLANGTYTVTIMDQNLCDTSFTYTITSPPPIVADSAITQISCYGANNGAISFINVSGGVTPYTYSIDGTSYSSNQQFSNLTPGTYDLFVQDNNNCIRGLGSVTITQPTDILIAVDPLNTDTTLNCFGDSNASITMNVSGGTPGYNYAWSNGTTNTLSINNLTAGTYQLTVTDANNCNKTRIIQITEPSQLQVTGNTQNNLCYGSASGSVDITAQGGTPIYSYNWSNSQTLEDLQNVPAGTYTVTVTDNNNCTTSAIYQITEPAALQYSSINYQDITCYQSNDGIIEVMGMQGGTPAYSYSINGNPAQSSQVFNNLQPGVYQVTITDANGCTLQSSNIVIQEPLPLQINVVQANTDTLLNCYGDADGSIEITAQGGISPLDITWSNGYQNVTSINNLSAGVYTVTVIDQNNCTLIRAFDVTQPSDLNISIDAVNPADCAGGGVNVGSIIANGSGGTPSYTLTFVNHSNNITYNNGNALTAGLYTVYITDNNNCIDSVQNVFVNSLNGPVVSETVQNVTCFGMANGSISVTANPSGGSYNWFDLNNNNLGFTSTQINNLDTGYYVVIYDLNGCFSSDTIHISQPDSIFADILIENVTCHQGTDGSLSITNIQGGTGAYTIQWFNGENDNLVDGLAAGTYQLNITDSNQCIKTYQLNINQPEPLQVEYTYQDNVCYEGTEGKITITNPNDPSMYQVEWNNGLYQGFNIENLAAGSYQAYIINTTSQCRDSITVIISQPDSMMVEIINEQLPICNQNNGSITLQVTNGTEPYVVSWPNGINGNDLTGFGFTNNQDYEIIVVDSNKCTAKIAYQTTQCIEVDSLYIPQFFSPNGDNVNDVWEIIGLEDYPSLGVKIFNRWGNLVYEKYPYNNTWNGISNVDVKLGNGMLPPGTYFYSVDLYGDGSQIINSFVEIRP